MYTVGRTFAKILRLVFTLEIVNKIVELNKVIPLFIISRISFYCSEWLWLSSVEMLQLFWGRLGVRGTLGLHACVLYTSIFIAFVVFSARMRAA